MSVAIDLKYEASSALSRSLRLSFSPKEGYHDFVDVACSLSDSYLPAIVRPSAAAPAFAANGKTDHLSARPKAYKQNPDDIKAFKKTLPRGLHQCSRINDLSEVGQEIVLWCSKVFSLDCPTGYLPLRALV